MPLSGIAQIFIRLFALYCAVAGVSLLAGSLFLHTQTFPLGGNVGAIIIYLVAAVVLWIFAPTLSKAMAKGNDGALTLGGITERQLHTAAFLCIGLFFFLSSFANVFNWLHYFAFSQKEYDILAEFQPTPSYSLESSLITMLAGLTLMLTAKNFATKMTKNSD